LLFSTADVVVIVSFKMVGFLTQIDAQVSREIKREHFVDPAA